MTRSKAWVRVSGIGDDMDLLIQEFNSVKEKEFSIRVHVPGQITTKEYENYS